jgi:hypothetical protein
VTNTLSRKYENIEALLCVISSIQANWVAKARIEWNNGKKAWTDIQLLQKEI